MRHSPGCGSREALLHLLEQMGIYDRDYYRDPRRSSRVGQMQMWSVTTWIIVINVVVFVLDNLLFKNGNGVVYRLDVPPTQQNPPFTILFSPFEGFGHFSVAMGIGRLEIWRFITFQFLHADLTHLIFNMFALFFFGPLIESYLGRGRYLAFYLLCGIGGPIAYIVLWAAHVLIGTPWMPLIGASAGIFGVLIAAAQVAPDATVLVYGIMPVKLRTFAWILVGIAVYTVLFFGGTGRHNAGGEAAHLGGAAVGYILIHNTRFLRLPAFQFLQRRRPPF